MPPRPGSFPTASAISAIMLTVRPLNRLFSTSLCFMSKTMLSQSPYPVNVRPSANLYGKRPQVVDQVAPDMLDIPRHRVVVFLDDAGIAVELVQVIDARDADVRPAGRFLVSPDRRHLQE